MVAITESDRQTSVPVGKLECVMHVLGTGATLATTETCRMARRLRHTDERDLDAGRLATTACGVATGDPGPGFGFVQPG